MANANRGPSPAVGLIANVTQVPSLLAQITVGAAHVLLLLAKLALGLASVPFLIPLLLTSFLATAAENIDKVLVGIGGEPRAKEMVPLATTNQNGRPDTPDLRELRPYGTSTGSYQREFVKGTPISVSR